MNKEEQVFFKIIDNAFNENITTDLPSDVDYDAVCRMADFHKILGIIVDTLVKKWNMPIDEFFRKKSLSVLLNQQIKTREFLRVYSILKENGVYPLVVKGIICRSMYGRFADLRPSSDEDILIRAHEYETVRKLLIDNGYVSENDGVLDKDFNEYQAISYYNHKVGSSIEVHLNLFGNDTEKKIKMNSFFANAYDRKVSFDVKFSGTNYEVLTMDETDNLTFLILHAYKHLGYAGFGIRLVLDIIQFINHSDDCVNWDLLLNRLKEIGAYGFFCDIESIGEKYFHLEKLHCKETYCMDELLEDILANGLFGNESQAQRTSISYMYATSEAQKEGKVFSWLYFLFPTAKAIENGKKQELDHKSISNTRKTRLGNLFRHFIESRGHLFLDSIRITVRRKKIVNKYDK